MKKPVSLILALALCAGLCVPALAADFSDVPAGHNFYDAIAYCAEKGIVGGYTDGTFQPAKTVTRSNFCVMLSRAFYAEDVTKYTTAAALQQDKFWPNYTALILNNAVTNTTIANCYGSAAEMNLGISRYDMAQLMTNIMNNKGFAAGESDKNAAVSQIADYSQIPSQYKDAVANVYALGIIGGYANGTFGGTVTMNRGQAAVVIYRMMQLSGGAGTGQPSPAPDPEPKPSVDPVPVTPDEPDPAPVTSTGGTLANGKAITEANVTEILNQLEAKYPNKTDFTGGYAGLTSSMNGNNSSIRSVTKDYTFEGRTAPGTLLTTIGCGGWAAFVADSIFGQTNVTWKKTTLANIRPGDLMIKLDDNGYLTHVAVCVGAVDGYAVTQRLRTTDGTTNPYTIGWNLANTRINTYDVYTAYGD